MKVRALLLAGVAALFLATGAAHATDKLPDTMTGKWCYSSADDEQTPNQMVLTRAHNHNCISVYIHQNGSDDDDGSCIFDKIARIRANAFLIYLRCKGEGDDDSGSGPKTYEIIDEKLVITDLSEG